MMSRIASCYMVHDDNYYLAESIASFRSAGEVFAFVSRVPWHDQPGDWEGAAEIARGAGAELVLGDWTSELEHRKAAFAWLGSRVGLHVYEGLRHSREPKARLTR